MSKVHKTLMRHDIVFLMIHVDVSNIEGLLETKPIVPIRLILVPYRFLSFLNSKCDFEVAFGTGESKKAKTKEIKMST